MGSLRLDGKEWVVEADPHVTMMLRRVFPRVKAGQHGAIRLTSTDEVCRNLQWFLDRFALDLTEQDRFLLRAKADAHRSRERQVAAILAGKTDPRDIPLALPLRSYQQLAVEMAYQLRALLLGDQVGLGKAQPLDAQVLTPTGWRRMGDLQVGDRVIDPDGGVGHVQGVYPRGEREVFRVTMTDGASTECCDEHLWLVQTDYDRTAKRSRVLPLSEMRHGLTRRKGGNVVHNYFLPTTAPVRYCHGEDLAVHPYLLGVLIGDGGLTGGSPSVSKHDMDLIESLRPILPTGVTMKREGDSCTWRLVRASGRGRTKNRLTELLRNIDLWGRLSVEKFIPRAYLHAAVDDRIALLAGLLDTDGDCTTAGVCIYNTSSPRLADDVIELVRSLGGIVTTYTNPAPKYLYKGEHRVGRQAYRLNIRLPFNPFRLQRKAVRWKGPYMARAIAKVEAVGVKPVQCIRVSTQRQLYVTDGHIVTHNTGVYIGLASLPRTRPVVWVTMTHLQLQAQRELQRFAPGLKSVIVRRAKAYPLGFEGKGEAPDVVILNYAKLSGWADYLAEVVRLLVFDEAQELRNDESARYKAALHIRERAQWAILGTGTPVYNYGGEIFNVIEIAKPGALGSWDEFVTAWAQARDGKGRAIVHDPRALGTHLRAEGLMLRRTRRDVGRELPALYRTIHAVDPDPHAIRNATGNAAELARIILAEAGTGFQKMQAAQEMDRIMRQATGIAKVPYVVEFVRLLLESGEDRVVVFAWHHAVYDLLEEGLQPMGVVRYTGQESPTQKEAALHRFKLPLNRLGAARVLLLSLRAGAGIDGLQHVCQTGVFAELDWSPKVHEQDEGRLCRDGQELATSFYYLVATSGSDPIVMDVLQVKTGQADGIVDPDQDAVGAQVDPDRIRRLAEAVLGCG